MAIASSLLQAIKDVATHAHVCSIIQNSFFTRINPESLGKILTIDTVIQRLLKETTATI
jgi:hypothetical protein